MKIARDPRFLAGLFTVLFVGAVARTAFASGFICILFPELGALAMDVFFRPGGAWARVPWHLAFTPAITAVLGVLVARHLGFGFVSVGLAVGGSILVLRVLKSPIAPAISAAVLAQTLGVKSWWYPPAILGVTSALALASSIHRRVLGPARIAVRARATDPGDDMAGQPPLQHRWIVPFAAFLSVAMLLAQLFHWRLILFPPLIVIAYEMFAHPRTCPWSDKLGRMIGGCGLNAAVGLGLTLWLGPGAWAAMLSVALGIMLLLRLDLHAPPALAVSLLPLVVQAPTPNFPLAVGIGASLLAAAFTLSRSLGIGAVAARKPSLS